MSFESIEIPKKVFGGFDNIFHIYLMRGFQKYGKNLVLTESRLRQGKNVLPDGLNWLCYFAGSSKSHCECSISFKIVVKSSKHFFWYFSTLETHSVRAYCPDLYTVQRSLKNPAKNFPPSSSLICKGGLCIIVCP